MEDLLAEQLADLVVGKMVVKTVNVLGTYMVEVMAE